MATKPSNLASWGTDTNFSSGPENGTAVKVEPSAGAKSQGWVPGQPFRGPRMNWWQNTVYTWIQYLNDLHNSADFLNKSYAWITGAHSFGGGVTTNGALDVNGAVTVAQDIVLDGGGNLPRYDTPLSHTIQVPTTSLVADSSADVLEWFNSNAALLKTATGNYRCQFRLPSGSTVQDVFVTMQHQAAAGTAMTISVTRVRYNGSSAPTLGALRSTGSNLVAAGSTGTGSQNITFTPDQNASVTADDWFEIRIFASDVASSGTADLIRSIRVAFLDPGPRNY